jgi:23S rRNA pseudouridine955/2504/2580 synthase/23S rRNA pseudouridine1911/1915/1917 synthase
MPIEIIYEDKDIIAINKPAGLLSIPDRYNSQLPSVSSILKEKYTEIFTIHRLDVGTSGLLLFAKNAAAHSHLNDQFAEHSVRKYYTAVLEGVLRDDAKEIDIPLLQNPGRKGGVIPSARGKYSLTILNVLERFRNATLVRAELRTGRLHQLRAHTAAIGHPLLVDAVYGNSENFLLSSIKRRYNISKQQRESPIISRPSLHSTEITFQHPNGMTQTIIADFPKDFAALLQVLRKYSSI